MNSGKAARAVARRGARLDGQQAREAGPDGKLLVDAFRK